MKRILLLIAIIFTCFQNIEAQSVTVDATIDSLQILIGGQAKVKLQVALDTKMHAVFPSYPDTMIRGVEVIGVSTPDTQLVNDGKRAVITQEYTITSFDSALYYLPPMKVLIDQKAYLSKALALKVYSIPVDTIHSDQFYGPKTVMKAPFAWEDWYAAGASLLLLAPFSILLFYLIKRICDNRPIIRKMKIEPKIPPHIQALSEMERIKNENKAHQGDPKHYYTELTMTIRTYIEGRFGFNALEMTSSEIVEHLSDMNHKDALRELKELFITADLVKFAKHNPMLNESDANLISAISFINKTKIDESEDVKTEPTEITIIEKRPLRTKILLSIGIAIIAVLLVLAIYYLISEIYSYFA